MYARLHEKEQKSLAIFQSRKCIRFCAALLVDVSSGWCGFVGITENQDSEFGTELFSFVSLVLSRMPPRPRGTTLCSSSLSSVPLVLCSSGPPLLPSALPRRSRTQKLGCQRLLGGINACHAVIARAWEREHRPMQQLRFLAAEHTHG